MQSNFRPKENHKFSVLAFGELLWDLLPGGGVLGGAPANLAFRLSSLNCPSAVITRLGKDALGEEAARLIRSKGVSTDYIQWDNELPTGTVEVSLNSSGSASYHIVTGVAYDAIELEPRLLAACREAQVLCYGTLIQRSEKSRETLHRLLEEGGSAKRFMDINLRKDCYSKDLVRSSLDHADILKINNEEVEVLAEMFGLPSADLRRFAEYVVQEHSLESCLITLGEKGVYGLHASEGECYFPGYRVEIVDTIGSGDAFSAAFLVSLLSGKSFSDSCKRGNLLGAMVAETKGGMSPLSAGELSQLLDHGDLSRLEGFERGMEEAFAAI